MSDKPQLWFYHNGKGWVIEHAGKVMLGPMDTYDELLEAYSNELDEVEAEVASE